MIFVWIMRQEADYYRTRSLAQAMIDPKGQAPLDAWKDYRNAEFPYLEKQQQKADQLAMRYFEKEAQRGPLTVVPLQRMGKRNRRKGARRAQTNQGPPQPTDDTMGDLSTLRVGKIGQVARQQRAVSRVRLERYRRRSD